MGSRSAVIVPITLPGRLVSVRAAADSLAARGVPAHVTVLFPFVPADTLAPSIRAALSRLAANTPSFAVRFDCVERRTDRVWLIPADQLPFAYLTNEISDRWPLYPPYGGIHDHLVAHLTVVEADDQAALDRAAEVAQESLPFEAAVRSLQVIVEDGSGQWHPRWRLPLRPTTTVDGEAEVPWYR